MDQKMTKTSGENEMCLVVTGKKGNQFWYGRLQSGGKTLNASPVSVEIDPYCLRQWDESRLNELLGTYHTHPNMVALPSDRDDRTMRAWVASLGRPLVALIEGVDGLRAWWYLDDEAEPIEAAVEYVGVTVIVGRMPTCPVAIPEAGSIIHYCADCEHVAELEEFWPSDGNPAEVVCPECGMTNIFEKDLTDADNDVEG